jgi:hypothetical protein
MMSNQSDHVYSWSLWKQKLSGAEDTVGSYGPDDKPTSGLIGPGACRAIALRLFGKDAENETATITIIGWNKNGPGQVLCAFQTILGAVVFDEAVLTKDDIADGDWYESDTYDFTSGSNACGAQLYDGGNQGVLIVPTLGYTDLDIRMTDKDGSTGVEAADICAIWRKHDAFMVI